MSELAGRKLGKYLLEAQLGEGGMASVYRSHHPQFNRPVAIKILPPAIGQDPSFRARFEREGRTVASLNHPNIIRIYDIDEADGLFYMVMDLLPGGTLEARLREGGVDRAWSANATVKMAEALEYAHSRGVIHRDIKPTNILLDADAQPILADFGIARLIQSESEPNLTSPGMVMGTPAYMAPEQLNGGLPDARSDIYALGVVLYQLLTGRAPFTGDTMTVVTAHLTKQPQPLRELVQDLPPALDAVVLQALAKQPEHRFKSAGVFAQALRSAAADLEPAMVRVASAARASAAPAFVAGMPTFGAPTLPQVASTTGLPPAVAPQTAGQKVARYMPTALGILGLLLVISVIAKYWALVTLLAILFGGGGFLFLYLRAQSQGRKAAQATTQVITTATARAAFPPAPEAQPAREHDQAQVTPEPIDHALPSVRQTLPLDEHDNGAMLLPDTPTEAVSSGLVDELPPTAALPAGSNELLPTEAIAGVTTEELAPTEAVPATPPSEQKP